MLFLVVYYSWRPASEECEAHTFTTQREKIWEERKIEQKRPPEFNWQVLLSAAEFIDLIAEIRAVISLKALDRTA